MTVLNFMNNKEYIEIVTGVKKAMDEVNTLKSYDAKKERILATKETVRKETIDKLSDFYNKRVRATQKRMKEIEASYKNNKNEYSDPAMEVLRRQDFDMEIELMSEAALIKMASDTERDLSTYELNKLGSLLKGKEGYGAIEVRKNKSPHEQDVNYKKLATELEELFLIRPQGMNTALYYPTDNSVSMVLVSSLDTFGDHDSIKDKERLNNIATGLEIMIESNENLPAEEFKDSFEGLQEFERRTNHTKEKKLNYKDDDPRIDRNNDEFDVIDRFMYLKERHHDDSNQMYNPSNENYNVMEHYDHLESKHTEALNSGNYIQTLTSEKTGGIESDISEN